MDICVYGQLQKESLVTLNAALNSQLFRTACICICIHVYISCIAEDGACIWG